jgi:hypothetical protein
MKILLIRNPQNDPHAPIYPDGRKGGACYQSDMLLHGLRQRLGNEVVEVERSWWMYSGDFGPGKLSEDVHKGFTIYRTLGDDSGVDRTDIDSKIVNHYFDIVIFGYVHYGINQYLWNLVFNHYQPNEIVYIDGNDDWEAVRPDIASKCIYFKRELFHTADNLFPISFAMPDEKIDLYPNDNKTRIVAPMTPLDKRSYIYTTEPTYYQQYADSLFGVTTKKGGWDCMRHYEILANNCIPWFLDIEQCPSESVMHTLPKDQLAKVVQLARTNGIDWFSTSDGFDCWQEINDKIQTQFKQRCTTSALADYVLDTIGKLK